MSKAKVVPAGLMLPLPLQFLAAWLAVWLGRVLQQEVDYLLAENRVLRERLGNKKLRLTVAERRRLAVLGEQMGRKALAKVATIARPETILRWYRELVANRYDGSKRLGPGRPRKCGEIVELVVKMARENEGWGYQAVAAGRTHGCAVASDGSLSCWGEDTAGETVPPSGTFVAVAAAKYFSCAIRSDGSLVCWGDNTSGQSSPPTGVFTDLAVGSSMEIPSKAHGCALSDDGKVTCWGDNFVGQTTPPDQTFAQLSAGDLHTCGLSVSGQLWCWGLYARQPLKRSCVRKHSRSLLAASSKAIRAR